MESAYVLTTQCSVTAADVFYFVLLMHQMFIPCYTVLMMIRYLANLGAEKQ